jgi:hypothetical protein
MNFVLYSEFRGTLEDVSGTFFEFSTIYCAFCYGDSLSYNFHKAFKCGFFVLVIRFYFTKIPYMFNFYSYCIENIGNLLFKSFEPLLPGSLPVMSS